MMKPKTSYTVQPFGRRLAGVSDLDSVAAELEAMLADTLAMGGSSRALLSQGAGPLSMTPSRDDLLHVHAHLLQLVSQAPTAGEVFRLSHIMRRERTLSFMQHYSCTFSDTTKIHNHEAHIHWVSHSQLIQSCGIAQSGVALACRRAAH